VKITAVRTFLVPPKWVFVKVETDSGVGGWGEAGAGFRARSVAAAIGELSAYLVGASPLTIERHWQMLTKVGFSSRRDGHVDSWAFSGADGKIARIEVRSGRTPTSLGARVGDSEARIKSLYAGRVTSSPHKYLPGGHYLTVTPADGSSNRIVFETNGKAVTEFRSGAQPAVEYVERCG
jgi:hypothetical protein